VADLLFVSLVIAFFAVAVLLVRACDRIIGPDPVQANGEVDDDLDLLVDLPGPVRRDAVVAR